MSNSEATPVSDPTMASMTDDEVWGVWGACFRELRGRKIQACKSSPQDLVTAENTVKNDEKNRLPVADTRYEDVVAISRKLKYLFNADHPDFAQGIDFIDIATELEDWINAAWQPERREPQ